ncbi:MAG: Vitamin transporter BtuB precursor [Pseudomonadota bacterium]
MNFKTPATLALVSLTSTWGLAQTSSPPNAPVQDMGRVEIKSNRDNVMEERRQSTAAKIRLPPKLSLAVKSWTSKAMAPWARS